MQQSRYDFEEVAIDILKNTSKNWAVALGIEEGESAIAFLAPMDGQSDLEIIDSVKLPDSLVDDLEEGFQKLSERNMRAKAPTEEE